MLRRGGITACFLACSLIGDRRKASIPLAAKQHPTTSKMKKAFLLLCMTMSVGLVLGACAYQNPSTTTTTTSSTTRAINTGGGGSGGSGGSGGAVPIKSQP